MTLAELSQRTVAALTPALGEREARATARLLLEDCLGADRTTMLLHSDRTVEPETEARFDRMCRRISAGEPPQYVTGKARFMGMELKVTPAVLIPRPETAELVDLITQEAGRRPDLRILDCGTGSGCIAIALARALIFPRVEAIDISDEALTVAKANAEALRARVQFEHADMLRLGAPPALPYDIIVSNPPYIADSERTDMETRVKDHEPGSALFVPDDDPLRFYSAVTQYAADGALAGEGRLYFEINPRYAEDLTEMVGRLGMNCRIERDAQGRERFAVCGHYLDK